jgi:hypothetical protein
MSIKRIWQVLNSSEDVPDPVVLLLGTAVLSGGAWLILSMLCNDAVIKVLITAFIALSAFLAFSFMLMARRNRIWSERNSINDKDFEDNV